MRLLKRVRKKRPKLYELYKLESSERNKALPAAAEGNEMTSDNHIEADNNTEIKPTSIRLKREKKEREPKIKDVKKTALLENITLVISVCSLTSGIGSTHTAKALAYFIKHYMKKSVCIIDYKGNSAVKEINGIEVFKRVTVYDLYDKYQYIILDVGKHDAAAVEEIKRSHIKIMCAVMEDSYLNQLAEFIEHDQAEKWKFIFNHVPGNKRKSVDDKMEDYEHWCMPVNDGMEFDKNTIAIFTKLVKGEKI